MLQRHSNRLQRRDPVIGTILAELMARLLQALGALVQVAQVGLPADGDAAHELAPEGEGHEGEVEGHDGRPELPRVPDARGDGVPDARPGLGRRAAGEYHPVK